MKKRIRSYFEKHPNTGLKPRELAKKFSLNSPHDYARLKYILFQLYEEGFLWKKGKRYVFNQGAEGVLTGTLEIVNGGSYGFVRLNNSSIRDIFIAEKNLGTAFHGDTVKVELFAMQKGKNLEGQITEVDSRQKEEIVGTLRKTNSFYFVVPDEPKIHRDIYISKTKLKAAKNGDKVVVGDIEWKSHLLNPEGSIKEVLGKSGDYSTEISALARELILSYKFPKNVLKEAEDISSVIPSAEIKKRLDLRNNLTFTIDPPDAKDFDDAVSIEVLDNGNYLIGVHIADVSHYLKTGSSIYKEAYKRATSIYFVGSVIPMLPEILSNKICSLVPNEDRLTYSVLIEMTPRCEIVSYKIEKSVINSKRRFTYDEVQNILNRQKGDFFDALFLLNKIAMRLRGLRIQQGSINFHTPEVEFKLDKQGVPLSISVKEIKDSHKLIEEFMLLANRVIAKHMSNKENKNNIRFVYRVHDLPDKEKVEEFGTFVKSLGYSFRTDSATDPKQFQKLLESVEGTEEEAVINEVAIRSMAKAIYSPDNIGHYGLGFRYYTHFTSPIRRFPDLIVHKLVHSYTSKKKNLEFSYSSLEDICNHSSVKERTAVNAERLSVKLKQMEFLKNKIGEEFHGVISGVTHFGLFIELNQNLAEGLVKLRDLEDDFYIFDEKNYTIVGRSTGRKYRLGDKVNVRVARVDVEKREIDFSLLLN